MTLIITTFVLILLLVAPKHNSADMSRRLAHLGTAFELYCQKYDGRMPPTLKTLADVRLVPDDFLDALSRDVQYVAAGRTRDALTPHGIVALENPAAVQGSILVTVLLADGNVLAVPADVAREAVRRPDVVATLESAGDGQLKVAIVDADAAQ
jgi:hypothetical protein